ncbi:uncharacterized protein V1513DRAFT_487254 [Lipomyces chichibuensis]|uniref:uncharacterized protein n=1 Tax=Lipomyces chichibuensis TaxID=1546026 RepID=UPI003343603F
MASMITRRKRVDYLVLNDGSDDEALPEDRLNDARSVSSAETVLILSSSPLSQHQQLSLQWRFRMMTPYVSLKKLQDILRLRLIPSAGSAGITSIYLSGTSHGSSKKQRNETD